MGAHDDAWLASLGGRFIVFDGPDGSGKSTQLRRFVSRAKRARANLCEVREPGGTPIGERIRSILLDPLHDEMALTTELMLYMASRAQLVHERILPALRSNQLVVADRFVSSTLAYQGSAGGLSTQHILDVANTICGRAGSEGSAWPHLTIIFDVDGQTAARRLNPLLDRMELKGAAFHARVRQGFLEQAEMFPERYAVVDARQDPDAVEQETLHTIRQRLDTGS